MVGSSLVRVPTEGLGVSSVRTRLRPCNNANWLPAGRRLRQQHLLTLGERSYNAFGEVVSRAGDGQSPGSNQRDIGKPIPRKTLQSSNELQKGGKKMAEEGIDSYKLYNFAFGANMNRHKMNVVRQLPPLASYRAYLPNYKLKFNHCGGFANVEPEKDSTVHGM